jgi:ATP-dependent RNA helicase DeaD
MNEFEKLLNGKNFLLDAVKSKGFEKPTEIQKKTIPLILQKKDVIAGAATGTGKTFAFLCGIVDNAKKDFGIQGLVLTPTRELAEQVADEIASFSEEKGLNVVAVYGGVGIGSQIRKLVSAEIVVGTPGRILDHLERGSINFSNVNTLVLDEADRMLDMGFQKDVEKIIRTTPSKRQTLLFSATISEDIFYLAKKYMRNPVRVSVEQNVDPSKLKQIYYDVPDNLKYSLLKYLLENEKSKLAMVFCNTRKNVDFLVKNLKLAGINISPIHGGHSQDKRKRILGEFHLKKVHVLVATDVASRGLHIERVSHVYNYDIPADKKEYIHRIGRTARVGEEGKVINLVSSRDYSNFRNIMDGDFPIKSEELPYIERARIRWIPDKNRIKQGDKRGFNRKGRFGKRNHGKMKTRRY